jgi:hypothetical protein
VRERVDALFVSPGGFFNSRRVQLATMAARHAIPMTSATREIADKPVVSRRWGPLGHQICHFRLGIASTTVDCRSNSFSGDQPAEVDLPDMASAKRHQDRGTRLCNVDVNVLPWQTPCGGKPSIPLYRHRPSIAQFDHVGCSKGADQGVATELHHRWEIYGLHFKVGSRFPMIRRIIRITMRPVCKNLGRRVIDLAVWYFSNDLLDDYCSDKANGLDHASGKVFSIFEPVGYTVADLEATKLRVPEATREAAMAAFAKSWRRE